MEGQIVAGNDQHFLVLKIPLEAGVLSKSGKSLVCHNDAKFQPITDTDYSVKVIVTRKLEGNLAHLVKGVGLLGTNSA